MEPNQTELEIEKERTISDLETLKVIADPLRIHILEIIALRNEAGAGCTVKEIAQELERPPTKLYYHINQLEKHDFIRVAETRIVSGIIEKLYQITARRYHVDRDLLSPQAAPGGEEMDTLLTLLPGVFEATSRDIKRSLEAGLIDLSETGPKHHRLILSRLSLTLTEEQAASLYEQLDDWIQEYSQAEPDPDQARHYSFLFALYPAATGHKPTSHKEAS